MNRIYCYLFFITLFLFPQPSFGSINSPSTATLTLDQAVHFITTDGSDVLVQPGIYHVEGTDNEIRLTSKSNAEPILLAAQQTPFPEEIDAPIAMSIPLEEQGVYIAWLQPGEKWVETIGAFSAIQKRGISLFNTPGKLTSQHIRLLQSFAKRLADDPKSKKLKNDWTQVVKNITRQPSLRNSFNVNEMVMRVMREAIVDLNKDKQYWRKKMGNDAQLANAHLQNTLQRLQQVIQQMSSISKMLHDTAMAIIRNLR